eukprot:GILK01005344.1.p1 GENE.GILK01005344.1~~GILK01005344.1.p1  ORF type:complete len:305 (+),score=22.70 GILK01005344.1:166-1080(+)
MPPRASELLSGTCRTDAHSLFQSLDSSDIAEGASRKLAFTPGVYCTIDETWDGLKCSQADCRQKYGSDYIFGPSNLCIKAVNCTSSQLYDRIHNTCIDAANAAEVAKYINTTINYCGAHGSFTDTPGRGQCECQPGWTTKPGQSGDYCSVNVQDELARINLLVNGSTVYVTTYGGVVASQMFWYQLFAVFLCCCCCCCRNRLAILLRLAQGEKLESHNNDGSYRSNRESSIRGRRERTHRPRDRSPSHSYRDSSESESNSDDDMAMDNSWTYRTLQRMHHLHGTVDCPQLQAPPKQPLPLYRYH